MTASRIVLSTILVALLAAAPALAAKVATRYDRDVDFTSFKTYKWTFGDKPRGPRVSPGGDIDVLIRGLVDEALKQKGLERKDNGEVDLLVTYDAVATSAADVGQLHQDIRPGVAWVVTGPIRSFLEGTLVLTFRDAATERMVWTGSTTENLGQVDERYQGDLPNIDKRVLKAIKKMMAQFPPKTRPPK